MLALALPATEPAPHRRRQPRHPDHDRGGARAEDPRAHPRARARSRRTRSSSTPAARAASTARAVVAAQRRLVAALRRDPEVQPRTIQAPALRRLVAAPALGAAQANLVDPTGRVAQIRAAGHSDAGEHAGGRPRRTASATRYIPAAGFPASTDGPADRRAGLRRRLHRQGLRRLPVARARGARALLPAPAARLPLGLPAAQGRDDEPAVGERDLRACWCSSSSTAGAASLGLQSSPQIEAWIPIFLFAMLFGLSMDYEVFLLSRMREEWDARHDNERAVAYGLEHTAASSRPRRSS